MARYDWRAMSAAGQSKALDHDFSNSADPLAQGQGGKRGRITEVDLVASSDGTVDALAVWWEVDLDQEGEITISTPLRSSPLPPAPCSAVVLHPPHTPPTAMPPRGGLAKSGPHLACPLCL